MLEHHKYLMVQVGLGHDDGTDVDRGKARQNGPGGDEHQQQGADDLGRRGHGVAVPPLLPPALARPLLGGSGAPGLLAVVIQCDTSECGG